MIRCPRCKSPHDGARPPETLARAITSTIGLADAQPTAEGTASVYRTHLRFLALELQGYDLACAFSVLSHGSLRIVPRDLLLPEEG